jgi:hypothetical protein
MTLYEAVLGVLQFENSPHFREKFYYFPRVIRIRA